MRAIALLEEEARFLRPEGLVERLAHQVQVNEYDVLFTGHLSHRFGVISERAVNLPFGIEIAAIDRSHEYGSCAAPARISDEAFEIGFVSGERPDALALLLLVVVAVLNEKVIAGFDEAQHLVEAAGGERTPERLA